MTRAEIEQALRFMQQKAVINAELGWAQQIKDIRNAVAQLSTAEDGRKAGLEEAAQILERGSFLHNEAPGARLAREAAAAIRRRIDILELFKYNGLSY